ncbi:MAG: DUF1566 domain-containing protein [Gammaproteobacteria bacterium]|nr:DUF1566 domain-containing protein [Gammaproteobacteria bacterium]
MVFSEKLVKRYLELKVKAPDCLQLMQAGAFMQVMNEDAKTVSEITGLKLQMAGEVNNPVVLVGAALSSIRRFFQHQSLMDGLLSAFSGVQTNNYWSSTTNAGNTGNAWNVSLNNGNVNNTNKTNSNYVWPVRGGE